MSFNFADPDSHLRSRYRRCSSVCNLPPVALWISFEFACFCVINMIHSDQFKKCRKFRRKLLMRLFQTQKTRYMKIGTKAMPRVFLMWRRVQFLALPTGRRHRLFPSGSSVFQSVTAFNRAAVQNGVHCGRTY